MRRHLALLPVLLIAACLGTRARQHALFPSVARAWPAVLEDINRGLAGEEPTPQTRARINQVDGAVRADDYALLRGLDWPPLEVLAVAGVEARAATDGLSDGVKASLLERVKQFGSAVRELSR